LSQQPIVCLRWLCAARRHRRLGAKLRFRCALEYTHGVISVCGINTPPSRLTRVRWRRSATTAARSQTLRLPPSYTCKRHVLCSAPGIILDGDDILCSLLRGPTKRAVKQIQKQLQPNATKHLRMLAAAADHPDRSIQNTSHVIVRRFTPRSGFLNTT
jgi:hypothetical protein